MATLLQEKYEARKAEVNERFEQLRQQQQQQFQQQRFEQLQ